MRAVELAGALLLHPLSLPPFAAALAPLPLLPRAKNGLHSSCPHVDRACHNVTATKISDSGLPALPVALQAPPPPLLPRRWRCG